MPIRQPTLDQYADLVRWNSPPWLQAAACRNPNYYTNWWFREKQKRSDIQLRDKARSVCIYDCPVRYRCLARFIMEPFGIFGGLDEDERKRLRDSMSRQHWHNSNAVRAKLERTAEVEIACEVRVS